MRNDIPNSRGLLEQLSANSTPYRDPLPRIAWDNLDLTRFWLPEPAISLYGTDSYKALSEQQRIRLSQLEFLHLIEAGLWLERIFLTQTSMALQNQSSSLVSAIYSLHELREEAGHSLMFLELKRRYPAKGWPEYFQRHDIMNYLGRRLSHKSRLFWIARLIGEEVPDRLNRWIHRQSDQICPIIHRIIRLHIMDEARHITHTQEQLQGLLSTQPGWHKHLYQPLVQILLKQFITRLFYPPKNTYEQAGLASGEHWVKLARSNSQRRIFIEESLQSALGTLRRNGYQLHWT